MRAGGTVNAIFRIGDGLVARFPLTADDPEATRSEVLAEFGAARELAGRTRFVTPKPVALGDPGHGYPLPWSVYTWIEGTVATNAESGASTHFAADLADLIAELRSVPTQGRTFNGTGRGGHLASHDEWVQECLSQSADLLDVPALSQLWAELRELPRGGIPDVMNHSDLMPGNILVADGHLTGVLDVGGLAPADPALDLVGAWHLLDASSRKILRDRIGVEDDEWRRGKAWAFEQAIGLVWYYVDSNPTMSEIGRTTLNRVLTES